MSARWWTSRRSRGPAWSPSASMWPACSAPATASEVTCRLPRQLQVRCNASEPLNPNLQSLNKGGAQSPSARTCSQPRVGKRVEPVPVEKRTRKLETKAGMSEDALDVCCHSLTVQLPRGQ